MALVAKAVLKSDIANGSRTFTQLRGSALDAAANQILMRGHAYGLAKKRLEMGGAKARLGGDLTKRDITAKIIFDIGKNDFKFAGGNGCSRRMMRTRERTVVAHDARGKSGCERVSEQASRRTPAFHLRFKRPADVFDLRVTRLKPISDSELLGVGTELF